MITAKTVDCCLNCANCFVRRGSHSSFLGSTTWKEYTCKADVREPGPTKVCEHHFPCFSGAGLCFGDDFAKYVVRHKLANSKTSDKTLVGLLHQFIEKEKKEKLSISIADLQRYLNSNGAIKSIKFSMRHARKC